MAAGKTAAFAPGRIELLGNHTDYNQGVVLGAAIDRGINVTGDRRDDGMLQIRSPDFGKVEIPLSELRPLREDRWANHAIILTPLVGETTVDTEIRRLQEKIRISPEANPLIVQLGWAFVAKARLTSDPGYYKLAEQCSELTSQDSDALLLKGHIFHALHRFKEAEEVARQLTAGDTSRWQYFALLGDALMEQGKLAQSVDAYQRMPGSGSYSEY